MLQFTSIEAYYDAKFDGLLNRLELLVLGDVMKSPGTTQGESAKRVLEVIDRDTNLGNVQQRSLTPRFATLHAKGLIEEGPARLCAVSGRKCLTWTATGNPPAKVPKMTSKVQQLRQRVAELERLCGEQQAELTKMRKWADQWQLDQRQMSLPYQRELPHA